MANGRVDVGSGIMKEAGTLVRHWWAVMLRGLVAVVFGILVFASPAFGVSALIAIFGVYALASGALAIGAGVRAGKEHQPWGLMVFEGVLSIAAGVLAFTVPGTTLGALVIVIGIWAVAIGIVELMAAFRLRHVMQREWLLGLDGVLSIAFGIYALMRPGIGALAITGVMGIYALLFGFAMIGLGFRLMRLNRELPRLQVPA